MTLGEGIIWSTLLIITFISILLLTKHKKWKSFSKILLSFVGVGGIIAISMWQFSIYENRPKLMTSLNKVNLGMREVDVTLAKGEPDKVFNHDDSEIAYKTLVYGDLLESFTFVSLRKVSDLIVVTDICSNDKYSNVLGFSGYSSETGIIKKLGRPENVSINEKGTSKIISYPKWNASFNIKKNNVTLVCVTSRQNRKFSAEYKAL